MSLEKTTWNLNDGSGVPTTVYFGINASTKPDFEGGNGTITYNYGGDTGEVSIDIVWMADTKGNFMYQNKGDGSLDILPTVSGIYHNTSALGWGTNFDPSLGGIYRVQLLKK